MSEILALFEEQELNRKWFEENRENLIEKYVDRFIAIYKQSVVDSDRDLDKLMERVEKEYPPEKVTVEYVSREKLQLIL